MRGKCIVSYGGLADGGGQFSHCMTSFLRLPNNRMPSLQPSLWEYVLGNLGFCVNKTKTGREEEFIERGPSDHKRNSSSSVFLAPRQGASISEVLIEQESENLSSLLSDAFIAREGSGELGLVRSFC